MKSTLLILNFLFYYSILLAGAQDSLDFICNEKNVILPGDRERIENFANKCRTEDSTVQIIHIGDSHLQAGFLGEKIRYQFNHNFFKSDSLISPGTIFPYQLAGSNNPYFLETDIRGSWVFNKNTDKDTSNNFGLMGISATTDSLAQVKLKLNHKYSPNRYGFDQVEVWHSPGAKITVLDSIKSKKVLEQKTVFNLNSALDSLELSFNPQQAPITLYGLMLNKRNASFNYHVLGLNGATAESYLKYPLFKNDLEKLHPDLVIVSLGTNEAYTEELDTTVIVDQYTILLDSLMQLSPQPWIIITTPGDHFFNRSYSNKNAKIVRDIILRIAKTYQVSIWDYYAVMGGPASMENWHKAGLSAEDKVHYKKAGYEIQADLFMEALLKAIGLVSKKEK